MNATTQISDMIVELNHTMQLLEDNDTVEFQIADELEAVSTHVTILQEKVEESVSFINETST